ncbi:Cof subfamily protein (haloacid dehalogenase superfamily) [Alkalibacillus filiformis]|uniref:Cof subfamily protein (Haloacid dehalogenase superfamily) n=1 Tax=Alkalibacillus filiformis TaxID=200990 RepID=A0ABU0DU19_9BACI|nr:Cof-type HAD-IIB family hydrolase [Alkalibacillus filiformis]MDQ0351931.1 Cof subfamily protein (haloacid dehalogenase superfamily) [Alkalibacillus filiformis]
MTNQHIVFFDIDGTLLDEEKNLPLSAKQAIQQLKDNGHEVAIATGRAPFMYKELREELGIDTYVSFNGQYVVLNGDVIYKNPLDPKSLDKMVQETNENNHPVVYMDHIDMKANVPEHDYITESISSLKIDQFPTYDPEYKNRELYQALIFCEQGEEEVYEKQFDNFDFIRWHELSTDVIPAGGSKAEGIEKIIERLNIPKERVATFGDSLNDLEMLSQYPLGVAMGNGHERAKEAAHFETNRVDEDGVKYGLKLVGLIK